MILGTRAVGSAAETAFFARRTGESAAMPFLHAVTWSPQGRPMTDPSSIERKRKMFERYPMFFAIGLAIIAISLLLMGWRQLNEQARLAEIFAGRGPSSPSPTYVAAAQLEQALHHIIEQLIFVGLAFLKLAIGFSIAVIVLHLKETGLRGIGAFHKAGVVSSPPPMAEPWFTKFPKLLLAGFSVVVFFFLLSFVWVYNEYVPLGDQLTTRMTLEAIIKPGKMIGTALLLLGIGSGLATIVYNLRMQAHALPRLSVAAARRKKVSLAELMPPGAFPRKPFVPLFLGFAIVITAYVPVAALLAWNRYANLSSAGWSSVGAESFEVILEHWIESYVVAGVAILLLGIGSWLLAILRNLRAQREQFMAALADLSGTKAGPTASPPRSIITVRALLGIGLGIVLLSLGFTVVWIGAGLQAVQTGAPSAVLADHVWEAFVKPFKFAGLAFIFLGIGVALSLIVVNLQMISMVLPGVFARFGDAARGRSPKPLDQPAVRPMDLFPKRLFMGILAGFAVVVTATVPLAWPWRIGTFPVFLGANLGSDVAAQAAFSLERVLEHLILPYKLTGLAIIFYSIGRYFTTIIGFVRARKAIVTEGVESVAAYVNASPASPSGTASESSEHAQTIRGEGEVLEPEGR